MQGRTNLGAMREARVIRFSGAPTFGAEMIVRVSPLATSFTMPLIQPELGRLFAISVNVAASNHYEANIK